MKRYQVKTQTKIIIDGLSVSSIEPFIVYDVLSRIDSWKSTASTQPDQNQCSPKSQMREIQEQLSNKVPGDVLQMSQKLYNIMLQLREAHKHEFQPESNPGLTIDPSYYPCPNKLQECRIDKKMVFLNQFPDFLYN